jgi:hypothetical protein
MLILRTPCRLHSPQVAGLLLDMHAMRTPLPVHIVARIAKLATAWLAFGYLDDLDLNRRLRWCPRYDAAALATDLP